MNEYQIKNTDNKKIYSVFVLLCTVTLTLFVSYFLFYTEKYYGVLSNVKFVTTVAEKARSWGLNNIAYIIQFLSLQDIMLIFSVAVASATVGLLIVNKKTDFFVLLTRYRFLIFGAVFFIGICLQLNGSSLRALFEIYEENPGKPLLGLSRRIRSDEYCVWTPMAVSQSYSEYGSYNERIAGGVSTIWSSVGGLPTWNLAAVFKPLYWGFLLSDLLGLDFAYGFSFLWVGRLILSLLVSFEFGRCMTKENIKLSWMLAFMISFCPYIQWYYSQSAAEVVIFSELALVAVYRFAESPDNSRKVLLGIVYAWSLGCLIMVAYPAWVIPQLYLTVVMTAVFIAVKKQNLNKKNTTTFFTPLLATLILLAIVVLQTWDTLSAVLNSGYPGTSTRVFTGGFIPDGGFSGLTSALYQFFTPDSGSINNLVSVFSCAPAGILLMLVLRIRDKMKDPVATALIVCEFVFLIIQVIGIPESLAKITLFSQCTRLKYIIGITDIFLLVRCLSQFKNPLKKLTVVGLTAVCIALNLLSASYSDLNSHIKVVLCFSFIISGVLSYLIFTHNRSSVQQALLCYTMIIVMVMCGGFVNPIEQGTAFVNGLDALECANAVDDSSESVWVCEGEFPNMNIPLFAGKYTPFSTHEYPDSDFWCSLDPEGEHLNECNNFMHVIVEVEEGQTEIIGLDDNYMLHVNINAGDLQENGIDYLLTREEKNSDSLQLVSSTGSWYAYKVS